MSDYESQEPDSTAQTLKHIVRFLRVVWHRRVVVFGTLFLCGLLGGLYYATAPRIYQANAQLLIVDTSREDLHTSMTHGSSDHTAMATYQTLVSSPLVLQSATTLLDTRMRNVLGSQDSEILAQNLANSLSVRGLKNTNILELQFQSPHQDAAEAVIAAIIQAYATFMDESHRGTANSIVDLLTSEKNDVDKKKGHE